MSETRKANLINVLVLILIIVVVLVYFVLPYVPRVRSKALRAKSANNLKQIYTGLISYSQENDGPYPAYASNYDGFAKGFDKHARGTDFKSKDEIPNSAFTNNITAALWLMARADYTPPALFVNHAESCKDKADPLESGKKITELYDFKSPNNFSYSFINFYDKNVSKKWSLRASSNDVFAGDDNDAGPKVTADNELGNSTNDGGYGQNFLFGDGHATWHETPMAAFGKKDNVYTYRNAVDNKPSKLSPNKCNGSTVNHVDNDVFLIPVDVLK